jgi:hypothetical protein
VKKNRGKPARLFKELRYQTLNSWSFERRVVAKAEHLPKGANPRFIVTSLTSEAAEAQELYEKIYCARGDMENRIKECQLDLFADRTSAASLRANQLRLWFASLAYVLVTALRRLALQGTELAQATAGTIRLKLLKLGALVTISVRRVKIAIASASPLKSVFVNAHRRLCLAARGGGPSAPPLNKHTFRNFKRPVLATRAKAAPITRLHQPSAVPHRTRSRGSGRW